MWTKDIILDPVPTIVENELGAEKMNEKKRQPFVTDETLCLEKTAYVGQFWRFCKKRLILL